MTPALTAPRSLRLTLLALTIGLAGCTLGPDYVRPAIALPAGYDTPAAATAADASGRWWERYEEPALNALIERALTSNSDIQQAAARVEQAAALDRQADAVRWPELALGGSGTRSLASASTRPAGTGEVANNFRASASSSLELDFWGRLRRASEAARAETLATRYAREVVRQTLVSQVADSYFELLALDRQIALADAMQQASARALQLQETLLRHGAASQSTRDQAEIQLTEARLQSAEYVRQRSLAAHRLALLAGDPALELDTGVRALPAKVPVPPPGLPATLLERRPDVRQAEAQLTAANARIGVAQAARLPSLSLTGSGGAESADLGDLLRAPSRIWSFGLGLDLPLFDAGRRAAAVDQARASQAEALAAYRGAAQAAFRDVADALANLRAARAAEQDNARREQAASRSEALTARREALGYASQLDQLEAQRSTLATRIQHLTSQQALLSASIALHKALGGDWSEQP